MKKLKTWFVIKPYKCLISLSLFFVAIVAHLISKTALFEKNGYINIIVILLVKNELWFIIIALLFLGLFCIENKLAKRKICEEGDEFD